jgi:hypothetical protein
VVGVDGQVQAHQLNEVLVLGEAELVGQVETVVLVGLDRSDLSILVDVAVDLGSDGGELGDQVHGVLEGVAPVVLLVDTLGVRLGELRLVLESSNSQGELGHGVESVGASVDELLDELGDLGASSPLGGESADLLLSGDLSGQEKPEETLRKRLLSSGSLGQESLALGDLEDKCSVAGNSNMEADLAYGLATETNTLLRVEDGTLCKVSVLYRTWQKKITNLPDKGLDTTGTTVDLVKGDLSNDLGTVLPSNKRVRTA